MVVIYLLLLKASNWNTLVLQTKEHHHNPCTVANSMLCFNILCQIPAKKYAATTAEHIKLIIEMPKDIKPMFNGMSTIW